MIQFLFIKQELIDFIRHIGEEKLKRIPLGMGSDIQREDRKGLFAAIKDEKNNCHFWLFYDIEKNWGASHVIIHNRLRDTTQTKRF